MNSIKPFQPAKGLVPTVRNISTLNDDLPDVPPVLRDDELTYKQDSGMTGELLLTLLEAMKQFRVQSGGSITVSNNTTVIRNNICSIVNNFRNAVSGRGSVSLDLLLKNIGDTFSSEAPSARSTELLIERLTEQINALGISAGRHGASAAEVRAAAGSAQRAVEQALKKNADLTGELSYFGGIPGEVQLRKLYPQPSVHNAETFGAENSLSGTLRSILRRENPLTYPRQAPAQGRSAVAGTPEGNRVPGSSAAVQDISLGAPDENRESHAANAAREPHESRAAYAPNAGTFTRGADITLLNRREFWYPKTAGFPAVNEVRADRADRSDRADHADSAAVYRYLIHRSEPADGQNSVSGSPSPLPPAELIQLNSYLTELRQPLRRETLRYAQESAPAGHVGELRGRTEDMENSGNAVNSGNSGNYADPRTYESSGKLLFGEGAVKLPGRWDYAYFAEYANYTNYTNNTNYTELTARQPRGSQETHAAGGFRETELFYLRNSQDTASADPERLKRSGDSHNEGHAAHAAHAAHADSAVNVPTRSPSPAPRGAEVTRYLAGIRRELIVNAAARSRQAAEVSKAAQTGASQLPSLVSVTSLGRDKLLRALLPGAAADSVRSGEAALHAAELIVLNHYGDSASAGNAAVSGALTGAAPVRKTSAEAFELLESHRGAALLPGKAALFYGSLAGQTGNIPGSTAELLRTLIYTENRTAEPPLGSTAAAEQPHLGTPAPPASTRPGYPAGTTASGELIYAETNSPGAPNAPNAPNAANSTNLPNAFSGTALTPPQQRGKTYLPAGAAEILPGAARSLLIRQLFGSSAAGNAGRNGTAGLPGREGIPGAQGASFSATAPERLPSAAQNSAHGGAVFTEAELLHISRTVPEGAPAGTAGTAGTARSAAAAFVLTQMNPAGNADNYYNAGGSESARNTFPPSTPGTHGTAQSSTLILRELRDVSLREELRRIILRDSAGTSVSAAIAAFNEPHASDGSTFSAARSSAADRYLTVTENSPGQETRTIEHFIGRNNYLQQIERLYRSEHITAGQRGIPGVTTNEDKSAPRGESSVYLINRAEASHNSHDPEAPVYGAAPGYPSSRDHRDSGNSVRRSGLEYFTSLVRGDLTLKNSLTEYFTARDGESAEVTGRTAQERAYSTESALLYAESGGGTIENGGLVLAAKPQNSPQERSDSPRAESSPADSPQPLPPAEEIYKQLNINSDISRLLSSEEALKNYVRNQINSYFSEQHSRSGDIINRNSYHSTEMICEQVITRLEHRLKTERRLNGR